MILIACVDERMGMMFNHRRISQDKIVCMDILDMCPNRVLYMEEYSYKLFQEFDSVNVKVIDNITSIQNNEYFFAENPEAIDENLIEKIVLYRWNRKYPADRYFPIDLGKWILMNSEEFAGKSHEKITKEVWER